MNGHVPQSISALAEVGTLMRAEAHIVSGQSNAPVNGIIQDGLDGIYIMTNRWDDGSETLIPIEVFKRCYENAGISKERCTNMLIRASVYYKEYISINKSGNPIFKKKKIPGKLYASILFPPNLNYKRKTDTNPNHPIVEIENGILLSNSGPLCKKIVGAKANSVVHLLFIEYSPDEALRFLSDCQQIVDHWLPNHGFSMGIEDCFATSTEEVNKTLLEMKLKIETILKGCNGIPSQDEELEINNILNSAMNVGLTIAKHSMRKGDKNALNIMRNAGAKGSLVNLTQIVCFVGQQNINGQRIPATLSDKSRSLPHFARNDHSAEARGFVENGYLKGLTPAETFFHAASGRTGIISTSIKSVTRDTIIFIIEDNIPKSVLIGEWIDAHIRFFEKSVTIQNVDGMAMEYLKFENENSVYIPTVDEDGNVSWENISAVTRHDPTNYLYKITTEYGRNVTVAESKSLIVWNPISNKLEQQHLLNIKEGDLLPVTQFLENFSKEFDYLKLPIHHIENPGGIKKFMLDRDNGYLLGAIISSCSIHSDDLFSVKPKYNVCQHTLLKLYTTLDKLKIEYNNVTDDSESHIPTIYINSHVLLSFVSTISKNLNYLVVSSLDFKEGLLDGYFSFGGWCDRGLCRLSVDDYENPILEANIINMLCNHFGIVIKFYSKNKMYIEGVFLAILKNNVYITNSLLREIIRDEVSDYNFSTCPKTFYNNILLDKIINIEKIEALPGEKLYDLTIPSTLNFCLANGLHVADTSDTGYIQKRVGRKIEDCKTYIDGTVRICGGRIIQFLYGDDGMNPKFLYVPKNMDFPFFVNPINIARRLNSDAVQKGTVNTSGNVTRNLYKPEINLIISFVSIGPPYLKSEVIETATLNSRMILKKLLEDSELKIYESMIPEFCGEIKNMCEIAKIQYGEMVGLHTASFIGEPTTQMMLDSVVYETELLVRERSGYIKKVQIGDFVNEHILKSKSVEYYENDKTYAGIDDDYYEIMATDEDGIIDWCKIEGVSKHPVINKDGSNTMLKITTEYCKEITATKAKSFLQLVDGKIKEVYGDDLKVGDYLPVSLNQIKHTEKEHLNMRELFPPSEYLYTSELNKAKKVIHEHRWWMKHANKTFILPHSRSDSVVQLVRETPLKNMKVKASLSLKDNCVYMKHISSCNYQIPENIPLDYNFGYLVGAYCADGCMTKHQISISKNDKNYVEPIIELCNRWNITTKYYVDKKNSYKEGWTSNDLRIYNTVLCRLLEKLCGKLSHNKFVSPLIIFSNEMCNRGFFDAYFGGDGHITESNIISSSVSKNMLFGISVMLRLFKIHSYVKINKGEIKDKIFPTYTTKKENIHQGYTLYIPTKDSKDLSLFLDLKISYKQSSVENLRKKNPKESFYDKFVYNKINGVTKKELRDCRYPDVTFEKIISIEEVSNTTDYAYDLSVAKTKNFEIWPGLQARDSFHHSGVKGKDVSLGVPRFNELLNATKSNKQKKISQTIYFDNPHLNDNREKIKEESSKKSPDEALIKELKIQNLTILENMKSKFEETTVNTFIKKIDMQYLSPDVNPDVSLSPIKILTYAEYEKKWWISLREELFEPPGITPEHWVVVLYFDIEKLYNYNIVIEEIALLIEENSEDKYYCYPSPNALGTIEVYCNFSVIGDYVKNNIKDDISPNKKSLITEDNINYFICRDVVIGYLCNIKLTGIMGIKKTFPREVVETGEWVLDVNCREIAAKNSTNRFIESLTSDDVDPYKTVIDDMHSIYATLGIEAARKFLIEEFTRIISFDGVYINPRHIQLLIDNMTYTGEITSVRRDGISRDVGPNAKIMFEQAVENAVEAAAFSEFDDMSGVSSAIMYGLTSKAGTGTVEVRPDTYIPVEKVKVHSTTNILDLEEVSDTTESLPPKRETPQEKRKRFNTTRKI